MKSSKSTARIAADAISERLQTLEYDGAVESFWSPREVQYFSSSFNRRGGLRPGLYGINPQSIATCIPIRPR